MENSSLEKKKTQDQFAEENFGESSVVDLYPQNQFVVSADTLGSVFERLNIPAVILGSDGSILYANSRLHSVIGRDASNFINLPISKLLPESKNWFDNISEKPGTGHFAFQIKNDAGESKVISGDTDHFISGAQRNTLITFDVSPESASRDAYAGSEALLVSLLTSIHEPAIIMNHTLVLYANQSAAALFGYANISDFTGKDLRTHIISGQGELLSGMVQPTNFTIRKNDNNVVSVSLENRTFHSLPEDMRLFVLHDLSHRDEMRNKSFQFCSMIHHIGDFYVVLNNKNEIEYINPSLRDFLEYHEDEILLKPFWSIFSSASSEEKWNEMLEKLEKYGDYPESVLCKKKSGELFYFSLNLGKIKKSCRLSSGYIIVGEDATGWMCEEKELQVREQRFGLILDNISDIILLVKGDGSIEYISPSVTKYLHFLPEEVAGRELLSLIPENRRNEITSMLFSISEPDIVSFDFEVELCDNKGECQFYHAVGRKFYEADGILKYLLVLRNIDQQKKLLDELEHYKDNLEKLIEERTNSLADSNARLKDQVRLRLNAEAELLARDERLTLALEVSAYGIWDIDFETNDIFCNDRLMEIFGEAADTVRTFNIERFESMIHPDDAAAFNQKFNEHLVGVSDLIDAEFRIGTGNGITKYISLRGKVVKRDSVGAPARFVGRFEDVTGRRRIEEKLQKTLDSEQELLDLKTHFISIVSHEYRTPLATILSSAEILEMYDNQLNSKTRLEQIKRIEKCVEDMSNLIESVIVLNRSDADNIRHTIVEFDLISYSRSIINEICNVFENTPTINFNPMINRLPVKSSPVLFKQIFSNLISNAVKFTPVGKNVNVSISVHNPNLYIEVQDEGIGISVEDQKMLFNSFFRGKNVGSIPGSGLGLPIAKKSIDALKGKMSFISVLNIGSTFRVELPLEYIE
ncbi:MAG: PAS domain-containing sensor histidine kinase [Ignavibacteriaceae bacterium]|nr:PAS domain-containing sensor histidine kinase [Ignavibacteriaceae bacterium]